MKTPTQPAGKPAGIICKYYPNLGEYLPSPTWPALAAEWYSTLTRVGTEGLDWYVFSRHERASDKEEFRACVAMLLAETEQHAHLSGYGYRGHYSPADLTAQLVAQLDSKGQAALRAVREWYTLAMLSPIEQFLYRARKIELWQNDRYQLATREGGHEEWGQEYAVLLLALQRAVPTAKKRLLRTAYTELKWLLPTLEAGRPLKWQRLYDEGNPFFSSSLTATYVYSEFVPLRPTQTTTDQITEFFFQYLHVHLFEKERHVWQALILLAGALGEAAPPTPKTFQEKQPIPAPEALDTPEAPATTKPPQPGSPALETPAPSPWGPLLTGLLKLPALFEFFADCGLLTPAGDLTALGRADGQNKARKAPWAGTLQALIQSRHLDGNPAAICRALSDPAGSIQVSLNEGTLRDYSAKAGTYLALANGYLKERGILRN